MLLFLPIIFALIHSPEGDQARAYDGATQQSIQTAVASEGKTVDFITQQEYQAFVQASNPIPPTPAQLTARVRSAGITVLSAQSEYSILQRAVADVIKDEINILRQWEMSFKAAVAASGTLAALKTNVAALPNLPDRNLGQLRTAITDRINSGAVDQ